MEICRHYLLQTELGFVIDNARVSFFMEQFSAVVKSLISAEIQRVLAGVQYDTFAYDALNVLSEEKGPKTLLQQVAVTRRDSSNPTLSSDKSQHANGGHPLSHSKRNAGCVPAFS